eukprot:9482886-Pyramimonas_sp.AAC.1
MGLVLFESRVGQSCTLIGASLGGPVGAFCSSVVTRFELGELRRRQLALGGALFATLAAALTAGAFGPREGSRDRV